VWAELIRWAEDRQDELGRMPYRGGCDAVNAPAVASWAAAGYILSDFYAQMVRSFEEGGPPETAELPAGYRLGLIDRDGDAARLHDLNERAFEADPDHEPATLEDFTRAHLSFSQFDPAWSLLVETARGDLAGSLIGWRPPDHPHGYIAVLAVDPAHRRVGLGRAMLLTAFSAIDSAGLPAAELYVASHNPKALDLYTSVGMHQGERINNYIRTP
jgi:mycothiol synthase